MGYVKCCNKRSLLLVLCILLTLLHCIVKKKILFKMACVDLYSINKIAYLIPLCNLLLKLTIKYGFWIFKKNWIKRGADPSI